MSLLLKAIFDVKKGAMELQRLGVPFLSYFEGHGQTWHWTATFDDWKASPDFEPLTENAMTAFSVSRSFGPMPALEKLQDEDLELFWSAMAKIDEDLVVPEGTSPEEVKIFWASFSRGLDRAYIRLQ